MDISIVEDDNNDGALLKRYIEEFAEKNGLDVCITVYGDAIKFLEGYKQCDVVFMDIQLPYYDGMKAAQKLREKDEKVVIVFVTTMAQFAVKGYSVNALDFVVKPINYGVVASKMKRILRAVGDIGVRTVAFSHGGEINRVAVSKIKYLEVSGHILTAHLSGDEKMVTRRSLAEYEKILSVPPHYFLKCNHFYLVNPRYIDKIEGHMVYMGDDRLQISRAKFKPFMEDFARFVGQNI